MKRLSTIIMALALVLGMSQCKKQETPTNGNGGEKVHITLNVSNSESLAVNVNDNGSRHDMSPRLGMVKFENGDVLHVGYNGHYFGQLTYQNGAFSGDLDEPAENVQKPLHFYFLGGKGINENSPAVGDDSFDFSIADQSAKLPVLCYGASNQNYGASSNYTATLEYKCALVRFDLANHGEDYIVTLSGVPTQVTVNFANPDATTAIVAKEGQTNADMTLYGEPGNAAYRWAILLKDTNLDNAQGLTIGSTVTNHVMDNNNYINGGISINNPLPVPAPDAQYAVKTSGGTLTQFSVSANKKVYFSRANLKCNTEHTNALVWSFHENQYDQIGASEESGQSVSYTNSYEMDRFSWGLHSPTTTGEDDFVDGSKNLSRADGTDWGCALTGEGNDHWRTLTAEEWNFLLNDDTGVRGDNRFVKACIKIYLNGNFKYINGLFIAPDNFDPEACGYTPGTDFIANTDWNNENTVVDLSTAPMGPRNLKAQNLFNAGCVFLPGLGYRNDSFYINYFYYRTMFNANDSDEYLFTGYYWSATAEPVMAGISTSYAHALKFAARSMTYPFSDTRDLGMPVRLVWDVN